jgi:glycosyltransferase involved in cell wall biosynthesis
MQHRSLVSTIIPVYNAEEYLAAAIESILAQSYRPLEIIVVDDGSTDGSAAVARQFAAVRYYHQSNMGQGAARNRGLELANGPYLAFLDADDLWAEDKLVKQMDVLAARPEVDMVLGHATQFRSPELASSDGRAAPHQEQALPCHLPGAMLIRRRAFDRVGPFDARLRVAEPVDWFARAREVGVRMVMLPDIVLKRRLHDDNLGVRERRSQLEYVRVLKRSLDRRRAAGTLDQ